MIYRINLIFRGEVTHLASYFLAVKFTKERIKNIFQKTFQKRLTITIW